MKTIRIMLEDVFEVFENKWTQMGDGIFGQIEGNIFGWSLSLSGDGKRFAAAALGAAACAASDAARAASRAASRRLVSSSR